MFFMEPTKLAFISKCKRDSTAPCALVHKMKQLLVEVVTKLNKAETQSLKNSSNERNSAQMPLTDARERSRSSTKLNTAIDPSRHKQTVYKQFSYVF